MKEQRHPAILELVKKFNALTEHAEWEYSNKRQEMKAKLII